MKSIMPTYFHGWRRKAGCVTLVMAMICAAAWHRSFTWGDTIACGYLSIVSEEGTISVEKLDGKPIGWGTFAVSPGRGHSSINGLHYRLFTIPLSLLCAYLLLSKPRSKQKST